MSPLSRLLLLVACLCTACAGPSPRDSEAQEVAALLANHDRIALLPPEEQRREFAAAQAAHDKSPSDTTRLNLALLMLLPRTPWQDDKRLHALLADIAVPKGKPSPRHDLAQFILRQAVDRQRRIEQLAQQAREERRRADDLQQKIESLKAIDRETRMPRKKP